MGTISKVCEWSTKHTWPKAQENIIQHKDLPTCECDVVNNVLKKVNIARLPMKMRTLAAERLQIVCEA